MIEVERFVQAPPAAVWRVLADGWSYASWVVGASRMRAVEPRWPEVGSRLHHSVGVWPIVLSDHTEVETSEPPRRLVLLAQGRPLGAARIEFVLVADGDGCRVRLIEDAVSGPGRLVPGPARQAVLGVRNAETLRRLAYLAEARPAPDAATGRGTTVRTGASAPDSRPDNRPDNRSDNSQRTTR